MNFCFVSWSAPNDLYAFCHQQRLKGGRALHLFLVYLTIYEHVCFNKDFSYFSVFTTNKFTSYVIQNPPVSLEKDQQIRTTVCCLIKNYNM